MTASGVQTKIGRGRRIIERPRLIKLLDETDARTILLLAPAGYGKTTLARQWAKGVSRVITLALTPSDRDASWFSEEIARQLEPCDAEAAALIREHIRARPSRQTAATQFGRATAAALDRAQIQLLVLDNYEALFDSPESEQLVAHLAESSATRLLVASRAQPTWASERSIVYGDLLTISRSQLQMTDEEVARVMGSRRAFGKLARQAQGWPAVIGLASRMETSLDPPNAIPQTLHRYLAEEVLSRASLELRRDLFTIALHGGGAETLLEEQRPGSSAAVFAAAEELGFVSSGDEAFELHPLLEEFLLGKLLEEPNGAERVREAILTCLEKGAWDRALHLTARFGVRDLAELVLETAFKPLVRNGRLAGLRALAEQCGEGADFQPPVADLVLAEVAFCDGNLELAEGLAEQAGDRFHDGHPLASRAAVIAAQARFQLADLDGSRDAYSAAWHLAQDERDETNALHGLASASIFSEHPQASETVDALFKRRHCSPVDFVQWATADVSHRQIGGAGLREWPGPDRLLQALPRVDDPRSRSAALFITAYALTVAAEYEQASGLLDRFFTEVHRFGLDFTLPLGNHVLARIALGQRRYRDAERALQAVDDQSVRTQDERQRLNTAALRSRLLLQSGDPQGAYECVARPPSAPLIPSWKGEYLASKALALAVMGRAKEAKGTAENARSTSVSHEVRVMASIAEALADPQAHERLRDAITQAATVSVWDPVLCALRAAPSLASAAVADPRTREDIGRLCQRANDTPLARQLGFRHRLTARPADLLSPREIEVLGLVARGYTNREISRALYIADSTTKVHIRHIFEKLGVKTRAEAVARFDLLRASGDG